MPSSLRRAALLLLLPLAALAGAPPIPFERSEVTVVGRGRSHRFRVEVAASPEQRARGLMDRDRLEPDEGMLFLLGEDRVVAMWMKDTPLPLDMLFLGADGVVRKVIENAEPEATDLLSSDVPVRAVLELRGGTARALGLRPGDRVRHAALGDRAPPAR